MVHCQRGLDARGLSQKRRLGKLAAEQALRPSPINKLFQFKFVMRRGFLSGSLKRNEKINK